MKGRVPLSAELDLLADKYATLADLRRRHAEGEAPPTDGSLRKLARAFPGALRELDRLPLTEIDARERALRDAARGGPLAPWMAWLHGYHGSLRAALFLKARQKRGAAAAPVPREELARLASEHAGYVVGVELVDALFSHGRCKIISVALTHVAELHEVDAELVRAALLPRMPRDLDLITSTLDAAKI